jgi:glucokinase
MGLDVGGTKVLGLAFDPTDPTSVMAESRLDTPCGTENLMATLLETVRRLDQPAGTPVGLGIAGLVDRAGGFLVGPNVPGVIDAPLGTMLTEALDGRVAVVNDASAAAWGEFKVGAGQGSSDFVMVTLGTGIGGGFIFDGQLFTGARGYAAEIGHMVVDPAGPQCPCGRFGCWERYASGVGLGRMAREAALEGGVLAAVELAGGDPQNVKGEHVTTAAAAGDEDALAVLDRFSEWLALGLANLVAILDPDRIVLGGGVISAHDLFVAPTQRHVDRVLMEAEHRPRVPIVAAALGPEAGAVGAGLFAAGS